MAFTLSGDVATTRTNLGLGDAATKTTGTASGNIPVLDSSGQIADAQIAALSVSKLSGVGTTGQVLTSTGTTTAPTMQDAAGGKVLQYFEGAVNTTRRATGSSAMAIFTTDASITPTKSGSRILVQVCISGASGDTGDHTTGFNVVNGAGSNLKQLTQHSSYYLVNSTSAGGRLNFFWNFWMSAGAVGTPMTFNVKFKNNNGTSTVIVNEDVGNDLTNITLMEVSS